MTAQVLIQQVLLKRGNTAVASAYVGPIGEVVVDTDLHTLRVQNASEPGGYLVATEAFVDAQVNVITAGIPNLVGNLIANTSYTPANPGDWNSPSPTTIQAALDRIVAALNTQSTLP